MTPNLSVLQGVEFAEGRVNTPDDQLLENIRHAIRQGHPQVRPMASRHDRVCLVGGGPSLASTFDELRELYFEGAKVVTVNGAYHWCLERNIRPSAQIVLDARPFNARFVQPAVPRCMYLVASQCAPELWAAVEGREGVYIWHAVGPDEATEQLLNQFYAGQWMAIGHGPVGGVTVGIRGIALMRTLGYHRFDLFGFDSCVLDEQHHAYAQPENDTDRVRTFIAHPGHPTYERAFRCTGWHLKQLETFLQMIRVKGNDFVLRVHGPGLLAYALETADAFVSVEPLTATAGASGASQE